MSNETVMSIEELRELCALTVELTRLRQNECKHLCIENFAPELLGKLIRERQGLGAKPALPWRDQQKWAIYPDGSAVRRA
jgi:hypothetical protein